MNQTLPRRLLYCSTGRRTSSAIARSSTRRPGPNTTLTARKGRSPRSPPPSIRTPFPSYASALSSSWKTRSRRPPAGPETLRPQTRLLMSVSLRTATRTRTPRRNPKTVRLASEPRGEQARRMASQVQRPVGVRACPTPVGTATGARARREGSEYSDAHDAPTPRRSRGRPPSL